MATIDNDTLVARMTEAYYARAIYDMGIRDAALGDFAYPQIDFRDIREGDLIASRRGGVTCLGRAAKKYLGHWFGEGDVRLASDSAYAIYLLDRAPDPRAVALAEAGYIPEDAEDILRVIEASKAEGVEW